MLSLFPELLDWSWYVPFLFRLFLAVYLCSIGWAIMKRYAAGENRDEAIAFIGAGALLVILGFSFLLGIFVQALGAIGFVLAVTALYFRRKHPQAAESAKFYLLIGIVSLSLVFLGPGPYSFDLPL